MTASCRERRRGAAAQEPEFEILDTGIFDADRYFDVDIEYAKADADDILLRLTIHNRGPEEAVIHVLPQVWFRNTWTWISPTVRKPALRARRRQRHGQP